MRSRLLLLLIMTCYRDALLQVFKFCCYVSIPVLMTVFIAGNPARLEAIIRNVLLSGSIHRKHQCC